ncbi:response regulator [Blastopirellula marina]|uniref:Two-component system response regulator-like protein (Nar family protein) n=1 Tax=Blastopirellula marina DSM 3645 TaxID=314230 RepID=A3ZTK8_9BACT|nr:response regulator transcription factor [Blastopirellula marina]EAQ80271.1 two-component system response regulator-like protein (Nar family protein) [Blastopirellula marina DSM 3645]
MHQRTAKKILIVDGQPLFRDGMAYHLRDQSGFSVCGEASGVNQALELLEKQTPDIALIDICLDDGNGLELIRNIKSRYPHIQMMVVSGYDDDLYAERALRSGASGYVNKREPIGVLLEGLRSVSDGKIYVSAKVTERMLRITAQGGAQNLSSTLGALTDRELEIFELIGLGMASREIAERLHLSGNTIDTYRERIKKKLGFHSGAELLRHAVHWVLENGRESPLPCNTV